MRSGHVCLFSSKCVLFVLLIRHDGTSSTVAFSISKCTLLVFLIRHDGYWGVCGVTHPQTFQFLKFRMSFIACVSFRFSFSRAMERVPLVGFVVEKQLETLKTKNKKNQLRVFLYTNWKCYKIQKESKFLIIHCKKNDYSTRIHAFGQFHDNCYHLICSCFVW